MFSREFVDVTPLQFILEDFSVSAKPLSAIIIKIKESRVQSKISFSQDWSSQEVI